MVVALQFKGTTSRVPQTFRNLGVKSGKTCSRTCLNAWENCGIYYIGIHFLLEIVFDYVIIFPCINILLPHDPPNTPSFLAAARQLPKCRKQLIEMIATCVATWPANFCCWVLALASWMDCWVYQALCISPKEEHVGFSFWYGWWSPSSPIWGRHWIWHSSLYMAAGAGFKPSTAWVMNGDGLWRA